MKTKQQMFNDILVHSRKQNRKAMLGDTCVYRTDDGRKCFVGALILDEFYTPDCERWSLTSLRTVLSAALRKSGIDTNDSGSIQLLRDLQCIHDYYDIDEWETQLCNFAHYTGLTFKVIE